MRTLKFKSRQICFTSPIYQRGCFGAAAETPIADTILSGALCSCAPSIKARPKLGCVFNVGEEKEQGRLSESALQV